VPLAVIVHDPTGKPPFHSPITFWIVTGTFHKLWVVNVKPGSDENPRRRCPSPASFHLRQRPPLMNVHRVVTGCRRRASFARLCLLHGLNEND
jgi:hypothetical protein